MPVETPVAVAILSPRPALATPKILKIEKTGEDFALQAMMSTEVRRRLRREICKGVFWGSFAIMVPTLVIAAVVGIAAVRYFDEKMDRAEHERRQLNQSLTQDITHALENTRGLIVESMFLVEKRAYEFEADRDHAMAEAQQQRLNAIAREERERRDEERLAELKKVLFNLCSEKGLDVPDGCDHLNLAEFREHYGRQIDEYSRRKRALQAFELYSSLKLTNASQQYMETAPITAVEARMDDARYKLSHKHGVSLATDAEVYDSKPSAAK